jgi:hypothetical protein
VALSSQCAAAPPIERSQPALRIVQRGARQDPHRSENLQDTQLAGEFGGQILEDVGQANVVRHQFAENVETAAADNMLQVMRLGVANTIVVVLSFRFETSDDVEVEVVLDDVSAEGRAERTGRTSEQIVACVSGDELLAEPPIQVRPLTARFGKEFLDTAQILHFHQQQMQLVGIGVGRQVLFRSAQYMGRHPIADARVVQIARGARKGGGGAGGLVQAAHEIRRVIHALPSCSLGQAHGRIPIMPRRAVRRHSRASRERVLAW